MDKTKRKQGIIAAVAIIVVLIAASVLMNNPPAGTANSDSEQTSSTDQAATSQQASESDGCITKGAYEKIKTGMSYDEVKKLVGSEGKNIFESGDKGTDSYQVSYMWIGKNGGEATIGFSGKSELKVLMKSQSELK